MITKRQIYRKTYLITTNQRPKKASMGRLNSKVELYIILRKKIAHNGNLGDYGNLGVKDKFA
jgi:hypothetical protein